MEGRVEGGRAGGDRPICSVTAASAESKREGLERGHRMAALERFERHVEHRHVVGHEEGIEPAVLELLRKTLEVCEIEIGIGVGAGIAPGAGMDARRPHECAEPQLPRCRHGEDPSCVRSAEEEETCPQYREAAGSGKRARRACPTRRASGKSGLFRPPRGCKLIASSYSEFPCNFVFALLLQGRAIYLVAAAFLDGNAEFPFGHNGQQMCCRRAQQLKIIRHFSCRFHSKSKRSRCFVRSAPDRLVLDRSAGERHLQSTK